MLFAWWREKKKSVRLSDVAEMGVFDIHTGTRNIDMQEKPGAVFQQPAAGSNDITNY